MSYIGRGIDQIDNISTLDNLTFNGSSATFNLTQNSVAFVPVSADALQIQIDGVIQSGNYTVSGSTVTFDFTPSGSSVCNGIRHFGVGLLTTVSDSSITTAKLGADSVNGSKIADNSISDEHLDNTAITGQTAITSLADTDKFLVSQASDSGNLKYVEKQYLGGGAMTLIARASSSGAVGDIAVDNCFSDTYDYYKIYFWINAEDDEGELRFRWRKSGSDRTDSYYINTGYASQKSSSASSSYTAFQAWNGDHFIFLNNLNENDNMGTTVELTIYDPRARDEGNLATVQYHGSTYRDDNLWVNINGGGFYGNQGSGDDFDGFKLYINNSNIKYYDYAIYGFNKT